MLLWISVPAELCHLFWGQPGVPKSLSTAPLLIANSLWRTPAVNPIMSFLLINKLIKRSVEETLQKPLRDALAQSVTKTVASLPWSVVTQTLHCFSFIYFLSYASKCANFMQRCLLAVTNIYPLLEQNSFEYTATPVSRHLREAGAQLLHSCLFFQLATLHYPSQKSWTSQGLSLCMEF